MKRKSGESKANKAIEKFPPPAPVDTEKQFTLNKSEDDPNDPGAWRASRACFTLLHMLSVGEIKYAMASKGPLHRRLVMQC